MRDNESQLCMLEFHLYHFLFKLLGGGGTPAAIYQMMENGMSEVPGRKESNCVRCRNHGHKVVLRGHKQYCPYAACSCDKCRFTAEQQRQMRLQNAIRRAETTDRSVTPARRQRNSSAPTMVPQQSAVQQQQSSTQNVQQQAVQHQQIIVTTVANPQSDQRNGGTPPGMFQSISFSFALQNVHTK